jgi:hypothetical protein
LQALYNAYEHFIADIARVIPVIKVDYSRFRTAEEMAKVIKAEYALIANVRHVHFDVRTPAGVNDSIDESAIAADDESPDVSFSVDSVENSPDRGTSRGHAALASS